MCFSLTVSAGKKQPTQVGKMPEIPKNFIFKVVMTNFWKDLEKFWHIHKFSSLAFRIVWWSLSLEVLIRSLSRSLRLDYISGMCSEVLLYLFHPSKHLKINTAYGRAAIEAHFCDCCREMSHFLCGAENVKRFWTSSCIASSATWKG